MLRILLIGSGGREHALAWRLSLSTQVDHIYVHPGNAGTGEGIQNVSNLEIRAGCSYEDLIARAQELAIGLVVIGPDDVVVDGRLEELSRKAGIPCFAPSKAAAQLEGSKTFAKDFMRRHKIPTADSRTFDSFELARQYIESLPTDKRIVLKADGLAAGKGVILPDNKEEALKSLRVMMSGKFGEDNKTVVIEDFLEGNEVSILTLCDGKNWTSFPPGQDHKRSGNGDQGPNTGGMGVYSPVTFDAQMAEIEKSILRPTFRGMSQDGHPFRGLLFTGVMVTKTGPKVIEYNVRFGDPETQSAMLLMAPETDLAQILLSCCSNGTALDASKLTFLPGFACNVIMASGGYPAAYQVGKPIDLVDCPNNVHIFHAGTRRLGESVVTAGGRVLSVAAYAPSLREAIATAYQTVSVINFEGAFYRTDIGAKGLGKVL